MRLISKIATVVWIIGLILVRFTLPAPPGNFPLYIGLAIIAVIPLVCGPIFYRVFGLAALIYSLFAAQGEKQAGIKFRERLEHIKAHIEDSLPSK